jgi:transglutaminase-like putative cysteine protease
MYYSIRHITRFRYSSPVSESVMEVRMQPGDDRTQRCLRFQLQTTPRAAIQRYTDFFGNTVHYFDVPGRHAALTVTAEALVQIEPMAVLPEALGPDAWATLDALLEDPTNWDFCQPSHYARPTDALRSLARELTLQRGDDPLSTLRALNTAVYRAFAYAPQTTRVDSPIDEILRARRGVCQDFAHVMIALVRELGIPCRYVSGYLFHRSEDHDRSEADATHAWVEALLPEFGWVGFDPTNNLLAGTRHVRTAVGRDYDDVPPTRGVYKGGALGELEVSVRVAPSDAPPPPPREPEEPATRWAAAESEAEQQQQQQQQ